MTERADDAPWWASDGVPVDVTEDPLGAHRAARAGQRRDEEPDVGGERQRDAHAPHGGIPWAELTDAVVRVVREVSRGVTSSRTAAPRADGTGTDPDHDHDHVDACQVCPVCAGLRVLGEVRPELVTHLSEAARHVTMAARAFVDAQADRYDEADGFERIDLDDDV